MTPRLILVITSCLVSVLTGIIIARQNTGNSSTASKDKIRPLIGFSMETLKEERWQMDRDLFTEHAAELGAGVLVQAANGDDSLQLTQVQSLLTQGIDVLVIIPRDGEAMAKAVELAHAAQVPVLAYDRLLMNCEADLYLTFDSFKIGQLQAQFLADRIPPSGKLRLVRIYGAKTDNNAHSVKRGQDSVLEPLIAQGRVEIILEDWATDWKPENAKKITNAAITRAGDSGIDAILTSNDGTAGGAIQALTEEGLAGKILVTGLDAELDACQRIVQGTQTMTVYGSIKTLARTAAESAVKLATGRPIIAQGSTHNGKIDVPTLMLDITAVTRDNLKDTVIKDGYHEEKAIYRGD
jgi:D-xylose transport system substrate-binding protein